MTPRLPPPAFEYLNAEKLEASSGRVRRRFRDRELLARASSTNVFLDPARKG